MQQKDRFFSFGRYGSSFELTSAGLHILAMGFMLLDHMWATVCSQWDWMTCVGRLAFPIFAFMTVEGYFHTKNFRRYLLRMLAFALISEIPFNLMYSRSWLYPFHQNVLWTFLLSLLCIRLLEWIRALEKPALFYLTAFLTAALGWVLGTIGRVDYYGEGVLCVLVFYFFRGRRWWHLLGQAVGLFWVNVELLGGLFYSVEFLGMQLEISQQGLAVLALIPIWLYRGQQGLHSKPFQYFCYGFYPVHMLLLYGSIILFLG